MSQDKGSLGDEELLRDKGTPPDTGSDSSNPRLGQIAPSYDMFGNQIMPAKADTARVPGGDRGSIMPDSSTAPTYQLNVQKLPSNKVKLIAAGVVVIALAGFGISKMVPSKSGGAGQSDSDAIGTKSNGVLGGVTIGGGKSPNDIFKSCSPSLLTLTIKTKAYALVVKGAELTAIGTEDPVMVVPDDEGNVRLYQDGKPASTVIGILRVSNGKIPVAIKLAGGSPVIYPLTKEGKPMLSKSGAPARLKIPIGIERYSSTSIGSGFFVQKDVVVTNFHVVSGPGIGTSGFAGGTAQITDKPAMYSITDKPIAFDKDHDLALLYVPGTEASPLKLHSDYGNLKVGQPVYALGSPKGLAGSLSEGLISSDKLRGSKPTDPDSPKLYLQHSAKIDHGNSGGPLVDGSGEVVGVNTAGLGNGAINLAVVARFVDELLSKPDVKAKIEELSKKNETDLKG